MAGPRRPRLGVHLSNHDHAAHCLELGRLAEAEGLDSVWLSEDLFFRGAVPIAGALVASTSRITIGFGVLTPQIRHVALLVMESAALVELAGPRFVFGVGAGVAARTRLVGIESFSPLVAVRDVVDVYRSLLAGETVTREAGTQRAAELKLSFPDIPAPPPVYVAAVGPKALEQAGRTADGVFLSLMSSHRHIAWARERVRVGAEAAGRTADLPLVVYVPMSIADDRRAAIDSLKPLIAYYLRRWLPIPSLGALFTEWSSLPADEIHEIAARLEAGSSPVDAIPDELTLDYCIAGTLGDCQAQVERLVAEGVTDVVVDPTGDLDARRRSIRAVGALRRALVEA